MSSPRSRLVASLMLVLVLVGLFLTGYMALTPYVGAESSQQQATPVGTPRPPTPTVTPGPTTEPRPDPGVMVITFAVGVAVGLAAGYLIWGRRRPTQGPIDRGPVDGGPRGRA